MDNFKQSIISICLPFAIVKNKMDAVVLYNNLDAITEIKMIEPVKNIHLTNNKNSCALDSILVALFSFTPNIISTILNTNYKDVKIVELQRALRNLENVPDITNLRIALKSWPHVEKYSTPGIKDAGEFLIYLLAIFPEINTSVKVFQTVVENIVTCSRVDKTSSPIQYISINNINQYDTTSSFISSTTQVDRNQITIERLIQADIVIFYLDRLDSISNTFNKKKIIIQKSLTTLNGDRFYLGSVVAYSDNHYVTYIRMNDGWYFYDDSKPGKIKIRDISDTTFPTTNGVLFFYFPDYSSIDDYYLSTSIGQDLYVGVFNNDINQKLYYTSTKFDEIYSDPELRLVYKNRRSDKDEKTKLFIHTAKNYCKKFL